MPLHLKIFSAVLSGCGEAQQWQVRLSCGDGGVVVKAGER